MILIKSEKNEIGYFHIVIGIILLIIVGMILYYIYNNYRVVKNNENEKNRLVEHKVVKGERGRRGPVGPTEKIKTPTILNQPIPIWEFEIGDSLIYRVSRNSVINSNSTIDTKRTIQPIKVNDKVETNFQVVINNQRHGPLKLIGVENVLFNRYEGDELITNEEYVIPSGVSCQLAVIVNEKFREDGSTKYNLIPIMCNEQIM